MISPNQLRKRDVLVAIALALLGSAALVIFTGLFECFLGAFIDAHKL